MLLQDIAEWVEVGHGRELCWSSGIGRNCRVWRDKLPDLKGANSAVGETNMSGKQATLESAAVPLLGAPMMLLLNPLSLRSQTATEIALAIRSRLPHEASAVPRTVSRTAMSWSTSSDVKSASGPCVATSTKGDSYRRSASMMPYSVSWSTIRFTNSI